MANLISPKRCCSRQGPKIGQAVLVSSPKGEDRVSSALLLWEATWAMVVGTWPVAAADRSRTLPGKERSHPARALPARPWLQCHCPHLSVMHFLMHLPVAQSCSVPLLLSRRLEASLHLFRSIHSRTAQVQKRSVPAVRSGNGRLIQRQPLTFNSA